MIKKVFQLNTEQPQPMNPQQPQPVVGLPPDQPNPQKENLDGDSKIQSFRRIVEGKQAARVAGVMVDLTSANAVVQVYDNLGDELVPKIF